MPATTTPRDFEGLNAVVTGGTGALGAAVVATLLDRGGSCHIPVLDESELERFPHADDPRVTILTGVDLASEQDAERFFRPFTSAERPLWASIHCAGGFAMSPIEKTGRDFERMMRMNAHSCFLACREAIKAFRARNGGPGPNDGGRIVNVAARPGLAPEQGAGMVPYTASKAAVSAITRALSAEVAGEGIWVNAVAPSILDTPANRAGMPDADHASWPKVEQVAATIAFLASPANAVTRGGIVPVYGLC